MIKRKFNRKKISEPETIRHNDGSVTEVDGVEKTFMTVKEVPSAFFVSDEYIKNYCRVKGAKKTSRCLAVRIDGYSDKREKCKDYDICKL